MQPKIFATNIVNLFGTLVQGALGLRFVFKLFGASQTNGFVKWVYDMSDVLLEPFRSIFPTRVFDAQYVLEFSTLFAMLVYALFAMIALSVVHTFSGDNPDK